MAEFPALPLWVQRYLGDTHHLSFEEHGAYLCLLMTMWIAPGQRIPNDDAWLARKFRCSESVIANTLRPLIKEFCTADGNWITQKGLSKEWTRVETLVSKRRASAKARWDKEKTSSKRNASSHEVRNAPIPIPITTDKKKDSCSLFDWPEDFREQFWERYPLRVGKKKSLEALAKVMKAGVPWAKLMAAVGNYADSVKGKEPQFIKHPTTWLNGAHWEDVLPVAKNGYHLPSNPPVPGDTSIFIKDGTPQWEAWQTYLVQTGQKRSPCVNFGWRFPSEWPPKITHHGQPNGKTPLELFSDPETKEKL